MGKQDPSISRPKEGQRPEEVQKQNIAKPAGATSVNTEVAVTAIQSAWRSSQHLCVDKAKKVNVQEMVENSDEAQSSVHQADGQTGKKKKAAPKGGGNKNMMKKEGKGDAVQKKGPDARDAAAGTNQDPSISTPREGQRPEEEQQQNIAMPAHATSVNTEVAVTAIQSASKSSQHQCADEAKKVNVQEMVENSDEAQSSVHQADGQTGKKKKAAPKGGGNKNMMKKEGKG